MEERTFIRMKNINPMKGFIHGTQKRFEGNCKDISKTGFAFISKTKLSINDMLTADIETQGLPLPPINITGIVVRCSSLQGGEYEVAVQAKL